MTAVELEVSVVPTEVEVVSTRGAPGGPGLVIAGLSARAVGRAAVRGPMQLQRREVRQGPTESPILKVRFQNTIQFPIQASHVTCPVGGRLKRFLSNLECITQDPWVLESVQGVKLEFVTNPVQRFPPNQLKFCKEPAALVHMEIQDLKQKYAVQMSNTAFPGFVSTLFLVQKKDWGTRLIII